MPFWTFRRVNFNVRDQNRMPFSLWIGGADKSTSRGIFSIANCVVVYFAIFPVKRVAIGFVPNSARSNDVAMRKSVGFQFAVANNRLVAFEATVVANNGRESWDGFFVKRAAVHFFIILAGHTHSI